LRICDVPASRGVYTLIIRMRRSEEIMVGRLGSRVFPEGYYSYTGSAYGRGAFNLNGRVKRHLEQKESMRWHIDYLLSTKSAEIEAVVFSEADINRECKVSQSIGLLSGVEVIMTRFGSSDCRFGCRSHLLYFAEKDLSRVAKSIFRVYEEIDLKPHTLILKRTP